MKSAEYYVNYMKEVKETLSKISYEQINKATELIHWAAHNNFPIYVFGNGGSASLSEHFSCDHTKGVRHDTSLRPNVISLSSNIPMLTAIANDYSYDQVFSKQLEAFRDNCGLAIGLSASGSSPNVCLGLRKAEQKGFQTLAFVGFDGGHIMEYNDANDFVYVPSHNYGVVEDCHQIVMHSIAQYLRTEYNNDNTELKL